MVNGTFFIMIDVSCLLDIFDDIIRDL